MNSKRSACPSRASLQVNPRQRALIWLQAHSSPRLLMSLMMASTIGCGFLTSMALHRAGIPAPIVRYPLAVLAAWAVFLVLVSVWVWWLRRASERAETARSSLRESSSTKGYDGWSGGVGSGNGSGGGGSAYSGDGGRFGGAGASDSFADSSSEGVSSGWVSGGSAQGGGKRGSLDIDVGDDAGFLLLAGIVAVAFGVFGLVFYVVYSAPTFFAELLIDGGVGTWLYKRADVARRPDWLSTAVQRSVGPVVVLLVLFIVLALVMQHVAPGATTLGDAWQMVRHGQ